MKQIKMGPSTLSIPAMALGIMRMDQKSLEEIADEIDQRIDRVREMVVDGDSDESCQAGEGLPSLSAR